MSSEVRDVGPYQNRSQVADQFENWSRGLVGVVSSEVAVSLLLLESLMLAGVSPTTDDSSLIEAQDFDPEFAQVLSGWLIRAAMGETTSSAYEMRLLVSRAPGAEFLTALSGWLEKAGGPGAASWLASGR